MGLLDLHTAMLKQAAEKQAEEQVMTQRVIVLEKYASAAQELMNQNYPNNHSQDDVAQLAELMLNHDIEVEEQSEKIAELDEAGRIMARAFADELSKTQGA